MHAMWICGAAAQAVIHGDRGFVLSCCVLTDFSHDKVAEGLFYFTKKNLMNLDVLGIISTGATECYILYIILLYTQS